MDQYHYSTKPVTAFNSFANEQNFIQLRRPTENVSVLSNWPGKKKKRSEKAIWVTKMQNAGNTEHWWGCRTTGTLSFAACGKWSNHFKRQCGSFLQIKHALTTYNPVITLLGIYPEEPKTFIHTKTCTQIFKANFIHNCCNLETSQVSYNRWMNKLFIQTMQCTSRRWYITQY